MTDELVTRGVLTQVEIDRLLGITDAQRAANTVVQANAVTALYGISGGGKSSLADTGAEYGFEEFGGVTLCYALDPGGFGTKRLALIRAGILRAWDPTNHVRPFETMELISMGAWPETIIDPERGYADPNVPLILPGRLEFVLTCPQGHDVTRRLSEADIATVVAPCPTCGVQSSSANTAGIKKVMVKSRIFSNVVGRIYDSFTAMCDRGLMELPKMSARGELAVGGSGGSVLGSADAFTQGTVTYGTGSKAQVGFVQNLAYRWLINIRQIADQKMPAITTFGVEQSKSDDESGGEVLLGLKVAGVARTGAACGWVGNLLHASLEPDEQGHMRHRLWLTNHYDPRDPRKIPYVAKHRGTPLGMPEYLEDPWSDNPEERAKLAWTGCSLGHFFTLLKNQFADEARRLAAKFPQAPALTGAVEKAEDEIIPLAAEVAAQAGTTVSRRRRPAPVTATLQPPGAPAPPSPIAEQLAATLAAAQQQQVASGGINGAPPPTPPAPPAAMAADGNDLAALSGTPAAAGAAAPAAQRARRPRPPTS